MKNLVTILACSLLCACSKVTPSEINGAITADTFIQYNIAAGSHYCDQSTVKAVSLSQLSFDVRFDSSAIYSTLDPENQYDINKLYGFSEGTDPHVNSARIGWAYVEGSLRLYAYAYNNGERLSREIIAVKIGETISCAISLEEQYAFSVNGNTVYLPRATSAATASGYQLYPYFGGDEVAPHSIRIFIRETAAKK